MGLENLAGSSGRKRTLMLSSLVTGGNTEAPGRPPIRLFVGIGKLEKAI